MSKYSFWSAIALALAACAYLASKSFGGEPAHYRDLYAPKPLKVAVRESGGPTKECPCQVCDCAECKCTAVKIVREMPPKIAVVYAKRGAMKQVNGYWYEADGSGYWLFCYPCHPSYEPGPDGEPRLKVAQATYVVPAVEVPAPTFRGPGLRLGLGFDVGRVHGELGRR